MPKKTLLAAFLFFVVTVLSGSVRADVITMNNGQTHEGKITAEEQDRVQIKLGDSGVRLWFSRDQILSIEKTESEEDPEKEEAESESQGNAREDARASQKRAFGHEEKEPHLIH